MGAAITFILVSDIDQQIDAMFAPPESVFEKIQIESGVKKKVLKDNAITSELQEELARF